jgi:hypothetical protein
MIRILFAATLFLSAALLFIVQPMTGKQLLPLAGGTPAVWNTCLVFFQAGLLLGYLYAHALSRPGRSIGLQLAIHVGILVLGFALVLSLGWLKPNPELIPDDANVPVLGLLLGLTVSVGAPFFVLSATAPLLQKWFAAADQRDPYPLYAASNAGSLIGLFAYPFLIEPVLTLPGQRLTWVTAFAVCGGLIGLCGLAAWLKGQTLTRRVTQAAPKVMLSLDEGSKLVANSRSELATLPVLRWVALAALTASLLISVTTHITTDIAPVPLLWVVPLGLYLLSFIIVFARWPDQLQRFVGRVVPMALCGLLIALATRATDPPGVVAAVHLIAFVLVCLLCHGELAKSRPSTERLTTFYLWIAFGGVLGGLLTALIAPLVFARLGLVEYPLAVVLAGLVRPGWRPERFRWDDIAAPVLLGGITVGLVLAVPKLLGEAPTDDAGIQLTHRIARSGLMYGLPAAAAFALAWRPVRFALALAAILLAATLDPGHGGKILNVSRNFFGTLRVTLDRDGFVRLWHGTTQHGMQWADDRDDPTPLAYYHPKGPLGRLFADNPPQRWSRIGVVGLGSGATAAYAYPNQKWVFFEIDPDIVRIARDERYFTYLSTSRAETLHIVLGDARRQLMRQPDGTFDLLILDAFSSDAIPIHLLTAEAFALYRAKLRAGGVLAFHLSNRYLNLPPLLARLAADVNPELIVRMDEDGAVSDAERAAGKLPSTWVFVADQLEDIGKSRFGQLPVRPMSGPGWTDDFSNVLSVWRRDEP